MSEKIFSSDSASEQHNELATAFPYWINNTFPEAKTLGDVVVGLRELKVLIDDHAEAVEQS